MSENNTQQHLRGLGVDEEIMEIKVGGNDNKRKHKKILKKEKNGHGGRDLLQKKQKRKR